MMDTRGLLLATAFLLVCSLAVTHSSFITYLTSQLENYGLASYFAFVAILTVAVVLMPVTVMPLIPVAASVLGPLPTALLSIVGWTLGGSIAFLLARYLGRPVLTRFISFAAIDRIEAKIPPQSHFWMVVLLRLTLPVDVASYALGLTKSLSFASYFAATVVGVSWFSFAFAYMGDAFFTGNKIVLLELVLISLGVFVFAWYILKQQRRDK